jgi:hypothetical protein
MTKLLDFIKSGPPAPRVVLLPDDRFFVRVVPVTDAATPAEVATQVELALETLSPFPPAQLYHGYYWTPGAPQVLIFASYRKRFTAEQVGEWGAAELVVPAFAAFLGAEREPATTLLFPSADGLTALYWDSGPVPSAVKTRTLSAEATDEERTQARDELLRAMGGSRAVIDLPAPPGIAVSPDENVLLFRAGEFAARLPVGITAAMDVRDKTELGTLRRGRARDLVLWRVLVASVWTLALLGVGEVAVAAGRTFWLKTQRTRIQAQAPLVDAVTAANDFANRIEDLSTKRLLPLEMVSAVGGRDKRGGIIFTSITASSTTGVYALQIQAQTQNSAELEVYRTALEKLPSVAQVNIPKPDSRNGVTTFTLYVTFKPDVIKPAT